MSQITRRIATLVLAASVTGVVSTTYAVIPSFPGAQGFGAAATGDRALKGSGDNIYVVTNLNDSGAGSFRDAVSASNRIIVFAVSGQINLQSAISAKSNLTILGQTAPGQGIAIQGREVSFDSQQNDIVQYLRFREGSGDPDAKASVNLGKSNNMILDHVSVEYAQWDNIDAVTVSNITIQNSILADPIKAQQFNMHTEGTNVTYFANIWANAHNRNPLAKSDTQYVNNVVYDYQAGYTSGDSGGTFKYDLLNNYFIAGPATSSANNAWYQLDSNQSAYASGNLLDSNKDGVLNGSASTPGGVVKLSSEAFSSTQYLPTLSAADAFNFTTSHSGDVFKNANGTLGRDQVDSLVVSDVLSNGTAGHMYNSENTSPGVGFGTIPQTTVSSNTLDTVPFSWLNSHGLSTTNDADLVKKNPLGYLMIEQYAYEIADQYANQTWSNPSGNWTSGTWSSAAPGIYDHALIRGTGSTNGAVTLNGAANAFSISIGGNGPASGESLTMAGGSLTVQDTITVGDQNNGTLTISGGNARVTNVQLGNTVWSPDGSSSTTYTGTLNLTGGTLALQQLVLGGGTAGNWTTGGVFNWNGGTLQAINTLTVNVPATLGANGGTLDSNGFDGTLSGVLSGPGSLTKIGDGTITLLRTNSYSGGTTISAGAIRAHTSGALGTGTVTINTGNGLQLDNGITVANNIVAAPGASEFVDIPTANASATLAGNISVTGSSNQYRLGISGSNATLTLTGASTTSTLTLLTRGNLVFAGGGSLTSSQAVNIGRSSSTSTLVLTVRDNAIIKGNGINLGGINGSSDDASTTVTLNNNATLDAGASALNLNNSAVGGTTALAVTGNATLRAGSVTATGSNQGQSTLAFNGGILIATAGDSATPFFPALGPSTKPLAATIQSGGLTVNDGGFGITIAQPLAGTGPLTKTGAGTLTLAAANSYTGATTVNAGTLAIGPTGAIAGASINVAHGAALIVASGATLPSTVNLSNNGNVTFNSARTLATLNGSATDALLHLAGAALTITNGGAYAGTITDDTSGGSLTVNNPMSVGSVQVGTLTLNKNLQIHATSATAGLNLLDSSNAWTTGLDLAGNKFILNATGASKADALAQLQAEVAYGATHAAGIFSSTPLPSHTAIAVIDNGSLQHPFTTFGGLSVGTDSLLVAPELLGDADANGVVDAADLSLVLHNFGSATTAWTAGNFDGGNTVDLNDLAFVLNNYGLSFSQANVNLAAASTGSAVPEPASLALIALGSVALIRRKRLMR